MDIINEIKRVINQSEYYNTPIYQGASCIQDIPVINREHVAKYYTSILSSNMNTFFVETSGSSGVPLKIAWKYDDYLHSILPLWRLRKKYGITPSDFFLTCHAGAYVRSKYVDSPILVNQNSISFSKLHYSNDIMRNYICQLEKFKPTWIYAQPSFVYFLGLYLNKNNPQLAYSFKYIELVGELLNPTIKKSIEKFFPSADVVNMYGLQEFNGVMYEENGVMSVIDENVYVEILREDGTECTIDEEGDIVVTGLKNTAFPLVRYNTKDRGKKINLGDSIKYVITSGRSNDDFNYGGRRYDGSLFFLVISKYNDTHTNKISKFQVIYEHNQFTFILFSFDNLPSTSDIEYDIRSILYSFIEDDWEVKVTIMNKENFVKNSSKTKYFINKSL